MVLVTEACLMYEALHLAAAYLDEHLVIEAAKDRNVPSTT